MHRRSKVAAGLIGLSALVAAGTAVHLHPFPSAAAAVPPPPSTPAAAPITPGSLPDFGSIVQQYGPAVVNVSTTVATTPVLEASPFGQLDPDDPFLPFFRRFGIPRQLGEAPARGLGSGFIVSSDGVILTNAHVVAGASEVRVKLSDRREFPAKVVGMDKATDVAVLRINAHGLPTVQLGDPARTRVGEWVLAIGAPFGFENSATAGIISARARSLPNEGYVPFLQTDVAVNPGNSGGPLFDLRGQVIGINSQIYSRSGGYMGLSFAIPIDVAMKVEAQLLDHGKVVRGQLGVMVQEVNQGLARSFGLARPTGALVGSVVKGSPAEKAGLQAGDVILSLDGAEVATSSDLPPRVADLAPGSTATLDVWRKGRHQPVTVVVGASGETAVATAEDHQERGRLGLTVRPLTPEERREGDLKAGVVVEAVSGPAARAGLQPGDVVLSLSGTPVTSPAQLRSLLAKAPEQVALLVQRGDVQIFVPVALG